MTKITDSVSVKNGTDYTFVCGKIPFAISCSSSLQHGAYNLIDLDLVNKMKIPLQKIKVCRMTYLGENLRSVGYIDQTIQCVHNGVIKGTIHLAAKVIRDLYDKFNVDCVASTKTFERLTGKKPPDPPPEDAEDDKIVKQDDVQLENGDDNNGYSSKSSSTCSDAIPAISKNWLWQASFMAEVAQKDSEDTLLKLEDEKALNQNEEEDTKDTDTKTEEHKEEEEESDDDFEKHCNLCFRFGLPIQITTNHNQNCPTCPTMSEKLKLASIGPSWKEKAEKIIRSRHEKQLRRGRRS